MAGLIARLEKEGVVQSGWKRSVDKQTRTVLDANFRQLLGRSKWDRLPPGIRRRFSSKSNVGTSTAYTGKMTVIYRSSIGWLMAQVYRLFGAPLPWGQGRNVPSMVWVKDAPETGGTLWARVYAFSGKLPIAVASVKKFNGPTGLSEYVGGGFGMSLRLVANETSLAFRSDRYFWEILGRRIWLPLLLSPGRLTVTHKEEPGDCFSFEMHVVHPWFGTTFYQHGVFSEAGDA